MTEDIGPVSIEGYRFLADNALQADLGLNFKLGPGLNGTRLRDPLGVPVDPRALKTLVEAYLATPSAGDAAESIEEKLSYWAYRMLWHYHDAAGHWRKGHEAPFDCPLEHCPEAMRHLRPWLKSDDQEAHGLGSPSGRSEPSEDGVGDTALSHESASSPVSPLGGASVKRPPTPSNDGPETPRVGVCGIVLGDDEGSYSCRRQQGHLGHHEEGDVTWTDATTRYPEADDDVETPMLDTKLIRNFEGWVNGRSTDTIRALCDEVDRLRASTPNAGNTALKEAVEDLLDAVADLGWDTTTLDEAKRVRDLLAAYHSQKTPMAEHTHGDSIMCQQLRRSNSDLVTAYLEGDLDDGVMFALAAENGKYRYLTVVASAQDATIAALRAAHRGGRSNHKAGKDA